MAPHADPDGALADRERIAALADVYGPLLTARQRTALALYYAEDLSLAEVAERTAVSRQAVHDLLRRTGAVLGDYEARLGLLDRERRRRAQALALIDLLTAARAGRGGLQEAIALARRLADG